MSDGLERMKRLILALMNDGMEHQLDAITVRALLLIKENQIWEMTDEAFNQFLETIKGHGGALVGKRCSICLELTQHPAEHPPEHPAQ